MNKFTQTASKVAALAAGFALVASVAVAPLAHAQTTTTTTTMTSAQQASLQAQIASLQAQLAASQGGSMSDSMMMATTFTTDLTIGSTGSQVTALQNWLISKGYSIPAGATGYFGAQTKAAVAAWQAASGISPAAGYFGPISRAKLNAMGTTTTTTTTTSTVAGCAPGAMFSSTTGQTCTTTTTTGTTTTGTTTTGTTALSGGEGSINNFQTVGAQSITLGTGASQQVAGFQFMAGGSDLDISRIYYQIYNPNNTGTTRPWNVFQTATLTDGSGNTVATLDASNQNNYSEDGTVTTGTGTGNQIYRLDFENINQVVKMNATQQYYLTLSTQSAFASGNVVSGTQFMVGLDAQGLRATDAEGIQQYSPSTPSLSTVNVNNNVSGTVTISTGSDNPQTTTLMANQNTATQGVVLNTFTLQNQGSTGVEVYTLPVTLTTSTGTTTMTNSSNLVQTLMLYNGSTLLDTESPSGTFMSGQNIVFKNINLVIPAGTTDNFSVKANIQPVGFDNNNPAPSGSSATVTVNPVGDDIETSGGSLITPTGASTGYPISFAVNGLSVASSPTTASATATLASGGNGTQQTGTFTFVFNVTAFGQTIYVASTSNAYSLSIIDQTAGAATSTTNVTSGLTSTANRSPLGNFQVNSGQTATFTVTATLANGGHSHYYYATLNNLVYGTSDANASTTTVTLPSNYTTNSVSISS
jgi:peptidoglycan hydrolase-like protein with peptidoglycan-binding domain